MSFFPNPKNPIPYQITPNPSWLDEQVTDPVKLRKLFEDIEKLEDGAEFTRAISASEFNEKWINVWFSYALLSGATFSLDQIAYYDTGDVSCFNNARGMYYYYQAVVAGKEQEHDLQKYYLNKAASFGCVMAVVDLNNIDYNKINELLERENPSFNDVENLCKNIILRIRNKVSVGYGVYFYFMLAEAFGKYFNVLMRFNKKTKAAKVAGAIANCFAEAEGAIKRLGPLQQQATDFASLGHGLAKSNSLGVDSLVDARQLFFENSFSSQGVTFEGNDPGSRLVKYHK